MQISFEKFLKLAALLAGSGTLASACTIKVVDGGNGGAPGAAGNAQGGMGVGGGSLAGSGGGGGASCVGGTPTDEGLQFDCSKLPYAKSLCPNPSGEGLPVSVPAFTLCERYGGERRGSVQVLVQCLSKLGSTDMCSAAAEADAEACERAMLASTCTAKEAKSACATIWQKCEAVDYETCIAELSPLSDARIDEVKDCVVGSRSTQCTYAYDHCRRLPDKALDVNELCAELTSECPAIPLASCKAALDIYGTGKILDSTYYNRYQDCWADRFDSCDADFAACTN